MHFTNYFCYSCYLTHVFNIATSTSFQKAPLGFEPRISCLLDRRFNQLSHGARCPIALSKLYFPVNYTSHRFLLAKVLLKRVASVCMAVISI